MQGIGVRGEQFMKKDIKYSDEPIGKIKLINDFLPSPAELVLKEETIKITLALTKESVDFFKKMAKEQHTHYQTMIRNLLDKYTEHYMLEPESRNNSAQSSNYT